ncbi:SDR family oxidoreductase [Arsenicitalea aurantiaca]|uniref:SDR family oxidoreductase n=1 Tax=Arsenicitalea aurantiaca TaxID=1783274 RepID=A0A433XBG9_9HYPH|nr:SDR family oxidoreductase [Arsenicitalea aurantiaca]RUT31370.1 SDR family oxidoreductase [Arsenicitalea aurantiaca]
MDLAIAGKRALVLGASRGLGGASARLLHAEGVDVIAAARSAGEMTAAERFTPHVVDLSDRGSVEALIAHLGKIGGVDILVNNTGGPKAGPAMGQTRETWLAAFETMATSIFSITEAVLPGMIERKWGRIITIGSSGIEQPIGNLALSNGVRAAIAGWSKTLASEVARHGITVNMVLPGRIDTDRLRSIDKANAENSGKDLARVQEASIAEIPAGRYGDADEFGAVVAFLAGAGASYVTGSMIRVDGGLTRSV